MLSCLNHLLRTFPNDVMAARVASRAFSSTTTTTCFLHSLPEVGGAGGEAVGSDVREEVSEAVVAAAKCERLSPWVAAGCFTMGVSIIFF
ncbi:hypothetical protein CsSME_00045244 [Camellia sinensis var. sinensis]